MNAKRQRTPEKLTCPCCGERRAVGPHRSPISDEAVLATKVAGFAGYVPGWSAVLAKNGHLRWSCDQCVKAGRALRAKPWLQQFCCDLPRFAYFDVRKICRSCGDEFTFSKVEQRRWFEDFKLTPSAEPVECRSCRAAGRQAAAANTELSASLASLNSRSVEDLAHVAALYLAIGSARKAAGYLRRAKNVAGDPAMVAQLVESIREVESKWPAV